ncbi:helix-turn-helix transcriptional regulator [Alteromonas lipolytica]|uniref:Helix-turn-helix transcriptional regulator n=1 Tax=Alteromonas lipolytica TaxID=1856405 RepID=A0A1E8FJH2_9ALTE|nr:LuxR C-terminal-related transcriptional regulator [Alteromonas lipolytica]OFI35583.1 helix-turn-helix transcriptional regulator [Alteromonas lipolytica]GGF77379.1 hypothetical protein GCM10011338_32120 [Alteromonas lipolytica]
MKDKIFSLALICIVILKCMDLYIDFHEDLEPLHIIQESVLILISSALFVFLIIDIRQRSNALKALKVDLELSNSKVSQMSEELKRSKRDFFAAVQDQFERWQLTPSEKEVGLFLLKGLSLNEIAEMRQTSEKTIRHQASAVYKKSECTGRHELAAFFFEELG